MIKIGTPTKFAPLLAEFDRIEGVIEFNFYDNAPELATAASHYEAAKLFMSECIIVDRSHRQSVEAQGYDTQNWQPYVCDETKLQGVEIGLSKFLGTCAIEPKLTSPNGSIIPNVDGFTTAFFHPPYGLRGELSIKRKLYDEITANLGCKEPELLMIHAWATDCSSYFDAGHEWWGAYFWTLSKLSETSISVITAAASD